MRKRRIDTAPILDDVRELTPARLRASGAELVTAGFPCQDVSCASRNPTGVRGPRTGIVFDIIEACRNAATVQHLLLENSACILTRGVDDVTGALLRAGFHSIAHGTVSASDVGALHRRQRWFCLASRAPGKLQDSAHRASALVLRAVQRCKWNGPEPVSRLVPKDVHARQRCMMLGNAVVPVCALHAFTVLAGHLMKNDGVTVLTRVPVLRKPMVAKITLTDGHATFEKTAWATPVHSVWAQYRTLTPRSTRMLSNQIFYEMHTVASPRTPISLRSLSYSINPEWVEWLMGFPTGWTLTVEPR